MPKPDKSYKNIDFLNSTEARTVRILSEYLEPRRRFRQQGVQDTIVMFGSARTLPGEVARSRHANAVAALEAARARKGAELAELEAAVAQAEGRLRSSRYYDEARMLSRRLTQWAMNRHKGRFLIATGGGPGIMEAGNRGAHDVEGGRSVGLGISLPFEEEVNQYVPAPLAFEFHYFFMRKYWFMYLAKAMVVFPGGFGTLDELAELLTLRQTRKVTKQLPIVLYGSDYWGRVLNLEVMIEYGTISERDLELFHTSDSVDDAFDFLTRELGG